MSESIRIHICLNLNPIYLHLSRASMKFRGHIKTGNNYLGVIQLFAVVRIIVTILQCRNVCIVTLVLVTKTFVTLSSSPFPDPPHFSIIPPFLNHSHGCSNNFPKVQPKSRHTLVQAFIDSTDI